MPFYCLSAVRIINNGVHRYDSLLKPYQSSARYVLEVSFILHLVHSSAILKLTTLQVGVKIRWLYKVAQGVLSPEVHHHWR